MRHHHLRLRQIAPDDLFGLGYPTGPARTDRFFAPEIDRGTERPDRTDLSPTSYGANLPLYIEMLRRRAFHDRWGIPNLLVLTVTTRPQRVRNMMEHVGELTRSEPKLQARFLFRCQPKFSGHWMVPPIMPDLLSSSWERPAGCEPLDIRQR